MIYYFIKFPIHYFWKTLLESDMEEIEGVEQEDYTIRRRFVLKGEEKGTIFQEAKGIIVSVPYNRLKFPDYRYF